MNKLPAIVLIVGSVVFLIAAFMPISFVYAERDVQVQIARVQSSPTAWAISQILFGLGGILVAVGLALFTLDQRTKILHRFTIARDREDPRGAGLRWQVPLRHQDWHRTDVPHCDVDCHIVGAIEIRGLTAQGDPDRVADAVTLGVCIGRRQRQQDDGNARWKETTK